MHDSNTWHQLLHYESNNSSPTGVISAIHSDEFFLSDRGKTDPEAELEANISAMVAPAETDVNAHAQCRFPARFQWLKRQSAQVAAADPLKCDAFNAWAQNGTIDSVSVIYAAGFLGNPASYYGHILLKFNSATGHANALLDLSVNYGAIVPNGEDPFSYMVKGLFGQYDAGFTHIKYYFHDLNYGELELRDLWEYQLDLPTQEVQLIVAHAWEVLRMKYTYYFLGKNCAHRVAELLELSPEIDIIPGNRPWKIPQSFIQNLVEEKEGTQSIVSNIQYHPSRQSRFYNKYTRLNTQAKKFSSGYVHGAFSLSSPDFQHLSASMQIETLDYLMDYFQYLKVSAPDIYNAYKDQHRTVLAERFAHTASAKVSPVPEDGSPHEDRNPGYFSVGGVAGNSRSSAELRIRPAYYDQLDAGGGHMRFSALSMFEGKFGLRDDKLTLEKFDVMRVENISDARTGLPGDKGESWSLGFGLEQQNLECKSCLVARVSGNYGYTRHLGRQTVGGILLGGGAQNEENAYGHLYASSSFFVTSHLSDTLSANIVIEPRYHFSSDYNTELSGTASLRFAPEKNWDIRINAEKNRAEQITLSVGYYW